MPIFREVQPSPRFDVFYLEGAFHCLEVEIDSEQKQKENGGNTEVINQNFLNEIQDIYPLLLDQVHVPNLSGDSLLKLAKCYEVVFRPKAIEARLFLKQRGIDWKK